MKYLFLSCILCVTLVLSTQGAFAEPENAKTPTDSKTTTVIVTEKIPGGDCTCIEVVRGNNRSADTNGTCTNPVTRKYSCTAQKGLVGFQTTFAAIIRYIIYIVMLLGVLGIVGLGIAWSIAGGDDIKAKTELKKWGVSIIIGLTILFFFSYILRFLAPWIYQ